MPHPLRVKLIRMLCRLAEQRSTGDEEADKATEGLIDRAIASDSALNMLQGKVLLLADSEEISLAAFTLGQLEAWLWNHRAAILQILAVIFGARNGRQA